MKIVSLLPSATEIVCLLGLREDLVGVTHECDFPADVAGLPKVTRTLIPHDASSHEIDGLVRERLQTQKALYSLDMPVLERLKPDLIVTQALCDVCAVADEEVRAAACSLPGQPRVVNLEPMLLREVFDGVRLVADAAGIPERGASVIAALEARVAAVARRSEAIVHRPRTMLLEWIDPPFSSGHWSPELIRLAGGHEVIGVEGRASRTTSWDEIRATDPEVLVVACCGFGVERTLEDIPILEGYPGYGDLTCVRRQQVYVVDGNAYFSRPGPRLVDSLEIVAHLLHPEVHPLPAGIPAPLRLRSPVST